MWKFSEGDINFFLCYEISATKTYRKHCTSWHYSLRIVFTTTLFTESTGNIQLGTIH
jgi:hypothetical protein